MEWIYFVVLFFWILSAVSKSKKKQLEAQRRANAARGGASIRPNVPRPQMRREPQFRSQTEADILQLFKSRFPGAVPPERPKQVETLGTFGEEETEDKFAKEEDTASHFRMGRGMDTKVSDMSNMPQGVPQMKSVGFDVYHQKEKVKPFVEMNASALKKYFVVSEIFGKPKALRRGR